MGKAHATVLVGAHEGLGAIEETRVSGGVAQELISCVSVSAIYLIRTFHIIAIFKGEVR